MLIRSKRLRWLGHAIVFGMILACSHSANVATLQVTYPSGDFLDGETMTVRIDGRVRGVLGPGCVLLLSLPARRIDVSLESNPASGQAAIYLRSDERRNITLGESEQIVATAQGSGRSSPAPPALRSPETIGARCPQP